MLPIGHVLNVSVHTQWPKHEHINDLISRVLERTYDGDEIEQLQYTGRQITICTVGVGRHDYEREGFFGWTDDVTTIRWRITELDELMSTIVVELD